MEKKYTSIENYIIEEPETRAILIISDWFDNNQERKKIDFIVAQIKKSGRKPVLLTSLHEEPYKNIPTICDFKVLNPTLFDFDTGHFLFFDGIILANASNFFLYSTLVEKHMPFIWYLTNTEQLMMSLLFHGMKNSVPVETIVFFKSNTKIPIQSKDDISKEIIRRIRSFSDEPNGEDFRADLETIVKKTKAYREVFSWWCNSSLNAVRNQLHPYKEHAIISSILDYLDNPISTLQVHVPENIGATLKEHRQNKGNILMLIHEFSRTGTPVACLIAAKILKKHGYFVTVIGGRDGDGKAEFIEAGFITIVDRSILKDMMVTTSEMDNKHHYGFESILPETDLVFMACILLYGLTIYLEDYGKNIFWWLHEGQEGLGFVKEQLPKSLSNNINVYTGGVYAQRIMQEMDIQYNSKILDYGIEHETFEQERLHTEKVKFLIAGTFCERKGQDIMAKAIRLLSNKEQIQSEFIFIGERFDVNIYQELELLSKENENCIVTEAIPYEAFKKLYATIDCVVCPSRDDPMPVVMTQALMMKKAVVCSTNTGTAYYIEHGENGYVFESEDAEALAKVLSYIINHKSSIEAVGEKGFEIYKKHFNIDTFEINLMKEIGYLIEGAKDK